MKKWLTLDFGIECTASVLTVTGLALGTSTLEGSLVYLLSMLPWWALLIRKRMWGLLPLNIASTLIITRNLFIHL